MRLIAAIAAMAALAASPLLAGPAVAAEEGEDIELVDHMSKLQYFLHKTHLSLRAGSADLAGLYIHELEEVGEAVGQVESYDGHPVGTLSRQMLMPAVEALDDALDDKGVAAARESLGGLIEACNQCHVATGHGYILIETNDANPYFQSFEP